MNLQKIKKLFRLNLYLCLFNIKLLEFLRFIYKFEKWHSRAPFICRPYKRKLVNEINSLDINITAVEIGGGMGDIISKIITKNKILIDLDKNLKKPVLLLHPSVKFIHGSFEKVEKIKEKEIDVLILVNWIHNLKKEIILDSIYKINKVKTIKYIVLDEINYNKHGYQYKHKFDNIKGFETYKIFDDLENIRKFRVLKCKNI